MTTCFCSFLPCIITQFYEVLTVHRNLGADGGLEKFLGGYGILYFCVSFSFTSYGSGEATEQEITSQFLSNFDETDKKGIVSFTVSTSLIHFSQQTSIIYRLLLDPVLFVVTVAAAHFSQLQLQFY